MLRTDMEAEPIQFFRSLEDRADSARSVLGSFVGADPDDLAFVANATTGVNTVLRSLQFEAGDEILITDHIYNACHNAAVMVAERWGARVVVARAPFPVESPGEVVDAITEATTDRTRLLLVDHVTSPTALVFPVERIVAEMTARGIDTLIDGAHAPGMIPVDIENIGAAYYTANAHKWMCAPKGAAFLHVRRDRQAGIVPTVISHGANSPRTDRSRFRLLFDWIGTNDPTAHLSIPKAIDTMASLVPGGWPALMHRNHRLILHARDLLGGVLGMRPPAPDEMLGAMAALPLTPASDHAPGFGPTVLQQRLWELHNIEVPVNLWPEWPNRVLRISAQIYNRLEQYEELADALVHEVQDRQDPG